MKKLKIRIKIKTKKIQNNAENLTNITDPKIASFKLINILGILLTCVNKRN